MKRRSKTAVILAAILAALLVLGVLLPILSAPAYAAWYDTFPGTPSWSDIDDYLNGRPKYNNRYAENLYDPDASADSSQYHGGPIINAIGMELSKDGNIKLVPDVRYRKKLTYVWQAWHDMGTASPGDDRWTNVDEATEPTFRPADFMQNGPQMVRLLLAHASGGADVSVPIIIMITDGAGSNDGFSGDIDALIASALERGYDAGGYASESGMEFVKFVAPQR